MNVNRLDHLVLTVASTEETVDFYTRSSAWRRSPSAREVGAIDGAM
jgi:catechol 2,3-dioxygenase-like lactoylglutathione lyase family enzyme